MLGKVVGGGMPVSAFGGRREIMNQIAPLGPVYQAGTLSGNPVAVAAGLRTLQLIQAPGFYDRITAASKNLTEGLTAAAREAGIPFCADYCGGMFGLYFLPEVPHRFADVTKADTRLFGKWFHKMLDRGCYLAPSTYEAGFVSVKHDEDVIRRTVEAARESFAELKSLA